MYPTVSKCKLIKVILAMVPKTCGAFEQHRTVFTRVTLAFMSSHMFIVMSFWRKAFLAFRAVIRVFASVILRMKA